MSFENFSSSLLITAHDVAAHLVQESTNKQRKFVETIELQIVLQNYDPTKDRRFSGRTTLPHPCRNRPPLICVIGDAIHCEEAAKLRLTYTTPDDLRQFKRNRKLINKWRTSLHSSPIQFTDFPGQVNNMILF